MPKATSSTTTATERATERAAAAVRQLLEGTAKTPRPNPPLSDADLINLQSDLAHEFLLSDSEA